MDGRTDGGEKEKPTQGLFPPVLILLLLFLRKSRCSSRRTRARWTRCGPITTRSSSWLARVRARAEKGREEKRREEESDRMQGKKEERWKGQKMATPQNTDLTLFCRQVWTRRPRRRRCFRWRLPASRSARARLRTPFRFVTQKHEATQLL
jgi:hypothetical protein